MYITHLYLKNNGRMLAMKGTEDPAEPKPAGTIETYYFQRSLAYDLSRGEFGALETTQRRNTRYNIENARWVVADWVSAIWVNIPKDAPREIVVAEFNRRVYNERWVDDYFGGGVICPV